MLIKGLTIFFISVINFEACGAFAAWRGSQSQKPQVVQGEDDLIRSVKDRDTPRVELLLSERINPDAREKADSDRGGETALNLAVSTDDSKTVRVLLKYGANVNGKGYLERTPLFHARSESVTTILLDAGADPNAKDVRGQTPLMQAAYQIARLLIQRGAEVNQVDNDGFTALSITAEYGEIEKINLLLTSGANVNARAKNGWTALIASGGRTESDTAEALLRQGADPNARMSDGLTALMRSAAWNAYPTAQVLLKYGADPNARMDDGRTALSIATESNNRYGSHKTLIDLLKKAAAKQVSSRSQSSRNLQFGSFAQRCSLPLQRLFGPI